MLRKRVISSSNVTILKEREKRTLADVKCYCKMMSDMALDGVTLFSRLKDVSNTQSNYWREFFSAMVESWKNLKEFQCVFVVYCVLERKRSALVLYWLPNSELLLNNSMLELIYFLNYVFLFI